MLLSLIVGAAMAQDQGRTVGEHRFEFPSVVPAPLVTTHFGFRQGAGYLFVPEIQVEGYDEAFDLQLFGATESIDIGVRLHPRIGLVGSASGQVTTGIDADSAFFQGARSALSWELGALGTAPIGNEVQGGVRLAANRRGGLTLNPSGIVDAVVEDREEALDDVLAGDYLKYLLASESELTYGGSVGVAWGPTRGFGLIASATLRHGTASTSRFDGTRDVTLTGSKTVGGSGLVVDLRPWSWPVKTQLEYRFRLGVEGPGVDIEQERRARHTTSLGWFYAGETRLQLGLLVAGRLTRAHDLDERYISGEFVMRYFFPRNTDG